MDGAEPASDTRRVGLAASVLIVDDDPGIREALRDYVELQGYGAVVAADGAEALLCLKYGPTPALILVDINMPRVDGEAFAARVRASPAHAQVPIVVMSASARRLPPRLASEHLEKPFDLERLDPLLQRLCGQALAIPAPAH